VARYSVKKVDKRGVVIRNFKEWLVEHRGELYHDSMTNYLFYKELKRRKIKFEYQQTFELQPKFTTVDYVIRKKSGERVQGWFKCPIRPITWSPDFLLVDYNMVIEAKGRVQETFPLKLKMFKYHVVTNDLGLRVVVLHSLDDLKDFLDKGLEDGE